MKLPLAERSNYYKGLLILVGRDRIVDSRERELMLWIGSILDFDKRFCDAALNDLLKNTYLKSDPIVFSQVAIAECFLHDAIRLAHADEELHPRELAWLKRVALANGLSDEWFDGAVRRFAEEGRLAPSAPLEIERLL